MTTAEFTTKADKTRDVFHEALGSIRTGRAHPSLVESITVEYYGTKTPLVQMATITTPEPRLLVIQPWDKSQLKPIEVALQQSDLQLPATNDGDVIRIAIPALTEERRMEYVKLVGKKHEEAKVALRGIREEAMKEIKAAEKDGTLSEDAARAQEKDIQELVERYQKIFEDMSAEKEKEITSIA